jgi:hypothetical protein
MRTTTPGVELMNDPSTTGPGPASRPSGPRTTRLTIGLLVSLVLAALCLPADATAGATAGATGATPAPVTRAGGNPLAGGTMGVYTGPGDGVYPAFRASSGANRKLLAKVAKRPRVRWLGHWISPGDIKPQVRDYIRTTQGGDLTVSVQMAMFRIWPGGEGAKDKRFTKPQRRAYKRWVDNAAAGIGSSRVTMVLEPDLPLALNGWRPRVRMRLTAYAARAFGALPQTTVYVDAGSADWMRVSEAVSLLLRSGIEHTRGFALGATHYNSVGSNLDYGKAIVAGLAAAGVANRRFVLDTADNGRPFEYHQYYAEHPGGDFDNAHVCRSLDDKSCVTLGIPPTTNVAVERWGLSADRRATAEKHVDAYLWFGRPWLKRQASPFLLKRTLAIARTTPF